MPLVNTNFFTGVANILLVFKCLDALKTLVYKFDF